MNKEDLYEAYRIAKQTLEVMDEFAGPINGEPQTLPGCLQLPTRIIPNPYQPQVLKKISMPTTSNTFELHTEKDDNPDLPYYHLSYQMKDFQDDGHISTNSMGKITYENILRPDLYPSEDNYNDEDWALLSMRKKISKDVETKIPLPEPVPAPVKEQAQKVDNYVQDDEKLLSALQRQFGFPVMPNPIYRIPNKNPLFTDDL